MTTKTEKNNYRNYTSSIILFIFILLTISVTSIFLSSKTKRNSLDNLCTDKEVGISLSLPGDWSCHASEQDGFYIEPAWVESRPNTGSSPQFNIWFKKIPDYKNTKVDPRFCHPTEYALSSIICPESVYYSHNGFEIKERVNKKRMDLGVTTSYVGIYSDLVEVQFNPSSSEFDLNDKYKKDLDSIFDSIQQI